MQEPLVSVIVPVFNQEKYLRKSIPSLLEQKYQKLQIVIINDGSTDQSNAILAEYAAADSRIKLVQKENGGVVDAVISGICVSEGAYIAFLDPDDYVGADYIYNFVKELDQEYDFIAEGFYFDQDGMRSPWLIEKTYCYDEEAIRDLRSTYLYDEKKGDLSHEIFHARWNKLYRAEVLKKVIPEYAKCRENTLGEDTIFTYLFLTKSQSGKSVEGVNSYYYNVSNPDSVTKNQNIEVYLQKVKLSYTRYFNIIKQYEGHENAAFAYYFIEMENLWCNLEGKEFHALFNRLKKEQDYRKAVKYIQHTSVGRGKRINLALRFHPVLFWAFPYFIKAYVFVCKGGGKSLLREGKLWIRNFIFLGRKRMKYLKKFRAQRQSAMEDLDTWMPKLDKRITEIIQKMDLPPAVETVEKNVFVFWWDGFEVLPPVVELCMESVRRNFGDYNIIPISKDNYRQYTDIDDRILEAYGQGKISIQTFSDILRFNLLKNHGGIWVDATLFFFERFDLLDRLDATQSFNSFEHLGSSMFLQYKNCECSWSGFFIASKRNGLFVRTMDYIFKEYYKKYETYPLYFFIDAAFMVCKLQGIDQDVLTKTCECDGDTYLLSRMLNQKFEETILPEIGKLPQKLDWRMEVISHDSEGKDTFYKVLKNME